MKKYLVSVDEQYFYLAMEIEAETKEEAADVYIAMVSAGDVPISESAFASVKVLKA